MSILINAYATHRAPPALDFPHHLNAQRDLTDPDLREHLDGFIGYVLSRGDKQMTQRKYHLMRHLQRVQHHLSLTVEEAQLDGFSAWAAAANAILYLPDGSVRDPSGQILLDAEGATPDAEARVPYPADAEARKARSMARLAELGIRVPPSLPPVIGEGEVELRSSPDAARRALALLIVAVRGEFWNSGGEFPRAELEARVGAGFDVLSPKEAAFLAAAAPERQEIVDFAWRYEALFLLEWALGHVPVLPDPTAICDVPAVVRIINRPGDREFLAQSRLRPAGEILDALDLHLRLHWAIRQARLDNKPAPAGLDPGVIQERHYALNWLVRFEGADWDDIDTPT